MIPDEWSMADVIHIYKGKGGRVVNTMWVITDQLA